jgi:enterochelin esterase-like enzyme
MALTGTPFLVLLVILTLAAFFSAAAWPPRAGRPVRGFMVRLLTQVGVSAITLALVGVVLNNQNGWYSGWRDLFASGSTSVQTAQGGASENKALAAKPTGPGLDVHVPSKLPPLPAPGQRVQTFTFTGRQSGLVGHVMVSLPRGYEDPANADKTYPVIEAFHGYPGTPEVWMQGVNLVPSIDALSDQHLISDAIVVAPQIEFPPGADTECVDGGKGQPQVETWLSADVPDNIASTLRVRKDRASWATLGFSSGGWCAAMAAMLHPDVFGAGVVLGGYASPAFGKIYQPFRAGDPAAKRYDLVALAQSSPPPVALWLQTSKADVLSYTGSAALLKAARPPLAIQSRVEVNAGHRIAVWAGVVPEALTWLGATITGFKAK